MVEAAGLERKDTAGAGLADSQYVSHSIVEAAAARDEPAVEPFILEYLRSAAAAGKRDLTLLARQTLTEVPAEVMACTTVEHLDMSHNALADLPAELAALTSLRVLNLACNALVSLGPLVAMPWIRALDMAHNPLEAVPSSIHAMSALVQLNLSHCGLTELPYLLPGLDALRLLDLSHNALAEMPAAFGHLHALRELRLDHNQLAGLPASVGHMTALVILYLDHNRVVSLPTQRTCVWVGDGAGCWGWRGAVFGGAIDAIVIFFDSQLGGAEIHRGAVSGLASLKTLSLMSNGMAQLPPVVGLMTALERLDLRRNRLSSIPAVRA